MHFSPYLPFPQKVSVAGLQLQSLFGNIDVKLTYRKNKLDYLIIKTRTDQRSTSVSFHIPTIIYQHIAATFKALLAQFILIISNLKKIETSQSWPECSSSGTM